MPSRQSKSALSQWLEFSGGLKRRRQSKQKFPVNAFRNIFKLSVGDFVAKSLNFFAFIYLARTLGVTSYGVLEFAFALLTYFLLFADGGVELWATREVARGGDIRDLVARIVPVRFILALGSFGLLLAVLMVLPRYPSLRTVLVLFGLVFFSQALNLKWVFMGQEKMKRVAIGLVLSQVLFVVTLLLLVRGPDSIIVWVAVARLAGDLAMVIYFAWLFSKTHGPLRMSFTLRNGRDVVRPALTLGASHGLALMSFNFDLLIVGVFLGAAAVGFYGAAYKPVAVVLAIPASYFLGLYPTLSRSFTESREKFREVVVRSLRLTAIVALPLGVGGIFLADPIIKLLFGTAYLNSVRPFQILSWSAVFVILRGTYRQTLNAAHRSHLDLRCAVISVALNIVLNLLLIPLYGIIGAAIATVVAEALWLTMAAYHSHRYVTQVNFVPLLMPPLIASAAMGIGLLLSRHLFWVAQALIGVVIYFGVLLLLGENEVRTFLRRRKEIPTGTPIGGFTL